MSLSLARNFIIPVVQNWGTPGIRNFLAWCAQYAASKNLKNLINVVYVMNDTSQAIYLMKKKALQEGGDAMKHQVGEGKDAMSVLRMSGCMDVYFFSLFARLQCERT